MGLSFTEIAGEDAPTGGPSAFVLHGILGSGRNWRSFARRLVRRHPGWRLILVDLRGHGGSPAGPPPHTVAACADDLEALADQIGRPEVVLGHSFGGKVALAWAARGPSGLRQAWALDSDPGLLRSSQDAHEVSRVIQALRQVPVPLQRRDALVTILGGLGFSVGISRWMTTNLERGEGGLVWRFDLDAAQSLIADYFALDLWPTLDAPAVPTWLVRAARSDRWTAATIGRAEASGATLRVLADAGHWVHVDNPTGLLEILDVCFGGGAPAA